MWFALKKIQCLISANVSKQQKAALFKHAPEHTDSLDTNTQIVDGNH